MADDLQVYYPEVIEPNPLPQQEGEVSLETTQQTARDEYSSETIEPQSFPTKKVAHELLASALNTKSRKILAEFEFTRFGALQIGEYTAGESGDIRISPNGIVARNSSGLTTFALDGTTGNAVFAGEVQAGSFISGQVIVGDNTIIIDGENKRIIINDGNTDRILIGLE